MNKDVSYITRKKIQAVNVSIITEENKKECEIAILRVLSKEIAKKIYEDKYNDRKKEKKKGEEELS